MRLHPFVALVLLAAGCSAVPDQASPAAPTGEADISAPSSSPAAPAAPLPLGQTAQVVGEKGTRLDVTVTGVYYHEGTAASRSGNGTFLAVAYRAAAKTHPDGIPASATGNGWILESSGTTYTGSEGAGYSPPWSGEVSEPLAGQDIQPGRPRLYVKTFDVPRPGGQLVYVNPGTKNQTRWQLPDTTSGRGYGQVVKALRKLGATP